MDDKKSLKVALIYFSGTHVTLAYARVIHEKLTTLGCKVILVNVTSHAARLEPFSAKDYDAFIFGFPVYSDFAPSVINEWLETLDGEGKRCGMFFTYGARTTGYAHFHTKKHLESSNFLVLFTAEFLGRHTFNVGGWQILPERPDDGDYNVARDYANLAFQRFTTPQVIPLHLQKPFGYNQAASRLGKGKPRTERGLTNPIRVETICSMCRDCETECPTQAFDADLGISDPATCIECMHCLYICPDEVIQIDKRMEAVYDDFKNFWHLSEEMMEAKESKIITESWQAAS